MSTTGVTLHKVYRKLRGGGQSVYYTLRWFSQDGTKRYSQSVGRVGQVTKAEAMRARREKETEIGSGLVPRDKPKRMTLKQFLEHDREAIRGDMKASTLAGHENASQHALKVLGGARPITAISRADVGKLKAYLLKGRSPATVRKTLVGLKAAFNRARKDGLVHENPFTGVKLPRVEARTMRIFSKEESEMMLKAAPSLWWRAFLRVALDTGLRKQELANLLWRDVDLEAMTVTVSAKKAGRFTVPGVGEFPILPWTAKAKASYRTVPFTRETKLVLERLKLKAGRSPYVFVGLDRLAEIDARLQADTLHPRGDLINNLLRDFKVIQGRTRELLAKKRGKPVEAVDWPVGTLHDLRRTWCTRVAAAVPMHVLKELAGHASISTTAAFYLAAGTADAEKVRAALSA